MEPSVLLVLNYTKRVRKRSTLSNAYIVIHVFELIFGFHALITSLIVATRFVLYLQHV